VGQGRLTRYEGADFHAAPFIIAKLGAVVAASLQGFNHVMSLQIGRRAAVSAEVHDGSVRFFLPIPRLLE